MKALLTASAAAAALTLSFSAPAFADCAAEIAALKSANFTGSVSRLRNHAGHDHRCDAAAPRPARM